MTFTRWALIGALTLMACGETEPAENLEDLPAGSETGAIASDSAVDPDSTDLAVWNTDADARLAPDEFAGWLDDQDFYGDWDTDGSDGLSAAEMEAGLDGLADAGDDPAAGPQWSEQGWSEWDGDGNGTLDRSEFNTAVFEAWDANGDGYVDETEWRANFDRWS